MLFDVLLNELIGRNVCPKVFNLLFDVYINQTSYIQWKGTHTDSHN